MPTDLRAKLLAFCQSLPGATKDVKWGADLVFSIGGKMFAAFAYESADPSFGCKVADDDFAALTSLEGIQPAPYAARYFWIRVDDPTSFPESELRAWLRGSYDLVRAKLPAKTRKELEALEASATVTSPPKKTRAQKTRTQKTRTKATTDRVDARSARKRR